ncbi:hypothetical protein [Agromyces larvae]|uniref:Transcriptional regulator, AbiEi antitoxin, Type IV TA system n=1 Tax=Agromyces larvae TaxID=2929802 RepID=A0ABY4C0R8_9MICO|nr:hypothetical protein [Agromyces larvae]UOE44594.1 hypothetical protein MTO99_02030 [Agromyces larvae]
MDLDSLPRSAGGLITFGRSREIGMAASLLTARDAGDLVAVRRGVYLESSRHARLTHVERHRSQAFAVAEQRPGVVFAGITAAILLGLPVVGRVPDEIVVLAPATSGRRRNGVKEIVRRTAEPDVTADGIATTSLIDTLIEVARTLPVLTALTMVDAALYVPRFDTATAMCTLDELRERFDALLPFPGSRRVSVVIERATHLAETPLETLSRIRIDELGFPQPELQVEVVRPRTGRIAHLDFAWREYGVWGEADGDGKYLGNARRNGDRRSVAEIVHDEKQRENEVRAATKWACARWDWLEAWRTAPLRATLLEAGLPIVRRRRR